jgi:CheY-like chemotaxis protein
MTGDELKCRAAGMDDYLVKPVSLNDLVAVFMRYLGRTGVEGR